MAMLSPVTGKPTSLMHIDNLIHDMQQTIITNNETANSKISGLAKDIAALQDLYEQARRAFVPYGSGAPGSGGGGENQGTMPEDKNAGVKKLTE